MTSYAQLQKQIASLQMQASKVRQVETASVIAKIKEAVAAYGLTPQDIFGGPGRTKGVAKSKSKASAGAGYADDKGNTWGGRGPRPQWLRDALAAGKSLSEFAVSRDQKGNGARASNGAAAKKRNAKRRTTARRKYRDSAGNSWSGHGRRPQWFKDAIASGAKLEDLLV